MIQLPLLPVVVTPPTELPVSLAEIKAHLRVTHGDEDEILQAYLDAATDYLGGPSGILGKLLVTQTWRQSYPAFYSPHLLPTQLVPVQSIVEIAYFDIANVEQVVDPAVYALVSNASCGPQIVLNPGQVWPVTAVRPDAVRIDFVAGYGAPAAVPATIKQAVRVLAAHFYTNREATDPRTFSELPYSVRFLLGNFRAAVI